MTDLLAEARAHSARIAERLKNEKREFVEFLIDLADFATRKRYETLGFPGLWEYCVGELRLSNGQTFYRTNAVYVLQKAPIGAEYLRDGRLCMTTIHELVDVIDASNARELLDLASWKSRSEVKEIVRARLPHPDASKLSGDVRKSPIRSVLARTSEQAPLLAESPPKARVEPLAEDRFCLPLRFDRAFKEKFERASVILSHIVPDRDPAKIFERGLDLILEIEAKRHSAPKKEVLSAKEGAGRPYMPADLERAVWTRDEGKCAWTMASGGLCGSEWQLQIDHILAVALGGKTVLENLRLLCKQHNLLHERQTFGDAFVENAIRERKRRDVN